jgi:hypothetical protein
MLNTNNQLKLFNHAYSYTLINKPKHNTNNINIDYSVIALTLIRLSYLTYLL